jgi:hypothetical protein
MPHTRHARACLNAHAVHAHDTTRHDTTRHQQDFCARKAAAATAAGSSEDADTWTFMGVLFEEDARRRVQECLQAA